MEIFSVGGQSKSKHKFGRMKVCEADKVREYCINTEIENEALGQCASLVRISEKLHASLVKIYSEKQL